MNDVNRAAAIAAKKKLSAQFFKKGVFIAILSGICYGLYSAFMTLGMTKGIWADWYGPNTAALSAFVITYLIGSLGSAINDTCSAVWSLVIAGVKGKLGDFGRCLKTKPGMIMIAAALIGGPISSAAYAIGLQMAGFDCNSDFSFVSCNWRAPGKSPAETGTE